MAHGTRIRPDVAAWAVGTVVDPAEFDALDEGQFVGINGDDGGTWAPSAAIIVGGSGLELTGADNLVAAGGTLTINGTLATSAAFAPRRISLNGATGDLDVNSGGDLNIKTGGEFFLESGAQSWHYSGSTVNQLGTLAVGATGIVNFANGSTLTLGSGTVAKVFCGLQIGANTPGPVPGIVQFNGASGFNGGYAYFLGPDCFNFANGATGQIGGVLARTGEGRITNRIITGADPGGGTETYGPEDADTIIAVSLSNPRIYDLSGAALHGDRITIVNRNVTHTVTLSATASGIYAPFGTVPIVLLNASGSRYSVTLEFSDGTGTRPAVGWYLVHEIRVP